MNAREFRTIILALSKKIGSRAYVSAGVNSSEFSGPDIAPLYAVIYPHGIVSSHDRLEVTADDWGELYVALTERWDKFAAEHRTRTIRKMALAIIRITAEQGECTDASLRADVFSAEEVASLCADACADADKIASNGPFSVTAAAKANAA